jgi:hypothetical protein
MRKHLTLAVTLAVLFFASSLVGATQATSPTPSQPRSPNDSLAALTPEQHQQYDAAGKDFSAGNYSNALAIYKSLLAAHPGDPLFSKFAAESAINTGDIAYAIQTLQPVEVHNADDWQAATLLARAYAESGDKQHRDAEMLRLADLHKRGITPSRLTQYIIEKIHAGDHVILLFNSFEPWGNYKIQNYARVLDNDGHQFLLVTLESADFDQPSFAKEHPKEAAAGARSFSLDAYKDTGTNSSGQKTQTHYTFKFFVGQPTYDVVRQDIIEVAAGKTSPISSRSGIPVQ